MNIATITDRLAAARRTTALRLAAWLARYSVTVLRVSLGLTFLGFGVLKFFPGMSPAEPLATQTLHILTLGLVPDRVALIGVASLESAIGILLLTGRLLRFALALLTLEMIGILSPLVLLRAQMFRGLVEPTLEGQYVLKDIVVAAAGLVVAGQTLNTRQIFGGPGSADVRRPRDSGRNVSVRR